MKENKIFDILRGLNSEEFERFADFICSPFFNKRTDMLKLINFLKPGYPEFDPEYTDNEKIYREIYGNGFSLQVVKNLLSRFKDLTDAFLTQLGLEKDDFAQSSLLISELERKNKLIPANKVIDGKILDLELKEDYTVSYLKKLYDYLEIKNDLISLDMKSYRIKIENSIMRGDSAVNYFLLALLRIANEYAAFNYVQVDKEKEKLYNNFFDYFDFEKYLARLNEKNSPHYAVIAIYYFGLLSKINDPKGLYREKLKKTVFENLEVLKTKDKHESWLLIFAAYIFTNTKQTSNVSVELHKVNKFFIDSGIMVLDDNGNIFENNYHNIAVQGLSSEDYEWVRDFLNKYKSMLPAENRENVYMYCMAKYLFSTRDYSKCVSYLSKINARDIIYNVSMRVIYIKCYYELGYFDEAESAIDAFRGFIKQSKDLTTQVKRPLPSFIRYSKLLVKIKASKKKLPGEYYLKAQKTGSFESNKWVLEKMKELI